MSLLTNKAFQPNRVSVLIQQKRFRSKINIQKPRAPHRQRQMVETFLTPFINNPDTNKHWRERCVKIHKEVVEKPVLPYDTIIARECLNWFRSSKMVAFFHMNSHSAREQFEFAVALKKSNMYLKGYQQSILELALKGTPYEASLKLMHKGVRVNLFAFGPEPNVDKLVRICKKTPNIILMAGILHGKLLHLHDFEKMGKLDLISAQAGLVQILRTSAGGNLNQQLTHHQSTLVTRLKQIGTTEDDPAKTTAGDVKEGEKV